MQLAEPEMVHANITSKVVWEKKEVNNIIGTIEGGAIRNQIILLSSHYDSSSSVLSVAPGANDAVGIATLLEIARLLNKTEYKSQYTISSP
jgi:Zn-dependent M28 family amino/carboxypeptidase